MKKAKSKIDKALHSFGQAPANQRERERERETYYFSYFQTQ